MTNLYFIKYLNLIKKKLREKKKKKEKKEEEERQRILELENREKGKVSILKKLKRKKIQFTKQTTLKNQIY